MIIIEQAANIPIIIRSCMNEAIQRTSWQSRNHKQKNCQSKCKIYVQWHCDMWVYTNKDQHNFDSLKLAVMSMLIVSVGNESQIIIKRKIFEKKTLSTSLLSLFCLKQFLAY